MRRSLGPVTVIGVLVACAVVAPGRSAWAFDVVLVPDQDTFINSAVADNNDGASPSLYMGRNGMGGMMRALIRFPIPAAWQGRVTVTRVVLAAVTRATGNPPTTPPTAATESLQALTTAWTEGSGFGDTMTMNTVGQACGTSGATWNQPDCVGGTPWAGGSVAPAISGVAAVPAMAEATVTWDSSVAANAGMLADVQGWVDAPAGNRGWRLASSSEVDSTSEAQRFYSREVAGKGPTLSITAGCRAGFIEAAGGCTAVGSADSGAGAVDSGADAGRPTGTPSSSSGCSCSLGAPGRSRAGGLLAGAGLLMAGLTAAARRRRSGRARPAPRPARAASAGR